MTNFLDLIGLRGDSFWRGLDELYYKKFPEEWNNDGEYFIQGNDYNSIIAGDTNAHIRKRNLGEKVTSEFIYKDGYNIWQVGMLYFVKSNDKPLRQVRLSSQIKEHGETKEEYSITVNQDNIIGKLRLITIEQDKRIFGPKYDKLIFEKVD